MELSNKLRQQQQQQIPLVALRSMANDYLDEKKGTIVLSQATNSAKIDLLEVLDGTD